MQPTLSIALPSARSSIAAVAAVCLAAACLAAACGSSGGAAQGSAGQGAGSVGSSASGGPAATSSNGAASGGAGGAGGAGSTSAGGAGPASSSATGPTSTSSGGGAGGGGSMWQPGNTSPIHLHWMIGGFTQADILSGQSGQAVYDIDGEGATAADVAAIHAAGAIAVCYVDVGTLENWRSDYAKFPSSVVGPAVQGWAGENWLLVTAANQATILPLMKKRFLDWCVAKGFDGIEPDNLDAWTNISGVSQVDNLAYDLAIAALAHSLPLSIGLKNVASDLDPSQYATFSAAFDWALSEQCYEYQGCGAYTAAGSFIPAGKAVFDVEYNVSPKCAQANQVHMNAQLRDLDLVGATASGYVYQPCVPDSQSVW
jgi:hypothetical protein